MEMKPQLSALLWALLPLFMLTSCNDDDDFPPASEVGIEGRVFVQNEFGQPLYDQRSGIQVFLEVGFRNFNLGADNVGRYRLSGAPTGSYTATYSKNSNYSVVMRKNLVVNNVSPNFEVLNGFQQFPSVTLTLLPITTFGNVSAVLQGNGDDEAFQLMVQSSLSPPPPPTGQSKGFRVFAAVGAEVNKDNYDFQKHMTTLSSTFSITLEDELFTQISSNPGTVISLRLYGDANFDESYEDPTGKVIFPNLSAEPSQIVSVVLP